jgi:hypothetical protein
MNTFLQFCYIKIYKWYVNHGEKDIPSLYSIGVMSSIQLIGAMGLIFLFYDEKISLNAFNGLVISILSIGLNYFFILYNNSNSSIIQKVDSLSKRKKNIYSILFWASGAVSVTLFLVSIILK